MARRFKVNGSKVAIWDGETDELPFTTPLSYLSRVKFHSDLDYIQTVHEEPVTLSLPARSAVLQGTASHQLFAHGKAGIPFILGKVTIGGVPCALTGSIPVQMGTNNGAGGGYYGRWIAIGADATYVYAYEYFVSAGYSGGSSSTWESYPAMSLPITIYVTDELL